MKHKVLWIEDGAHGDLPDLIAPVNVEGSYDLTIAFNATQAIEFILENEYAAVIVDIRLPPGDDQRWIDIYNSPDTNKNAERLGLLILRSLLRPDLSEVKISKQEWFTENVIGVLTVENQDEVQGDLDELQIKVYCQKNKRPSPDTLLRLIRTVMENAAVVKASVAKDSA